jgi:anaerobic magnesium-protoporphyrin IX monomethyl ester cyclase
MKLTLVNADLPSATPALPLGLVSLAHAATCAGHKVGLRDYQLASPDNSRDPNTFASFCTTRDDVIGVSTTGMALPLVIAALRRLKMQRPDLITVLGGIGAAGADVQIINEFPWIDFVCRGEGEKPMKELLDCLDAGKDTCSIEGFACRSGGKPRVNPLPRRITDLDSIEAHAWDYLDLNNYKVINMVTSRGCPFPCTFCDVAPYWQCSNTVRSVSAVIDEIRAFRERLPGNATFIFIDDTLTINRRRMEALCRGLGNLEGDIRWGCYARADMLDDDLLGLMGRCGCKKVYLGLESGSDHVLHETKKGFDTETGRKAALMARKYIPIVQTSFVWGFPFETWDDFYETLMLMVYLASHDISVKANVLTPLPFSGMFREYGDTMCFLPDYSPQLHLAGYESRNELVDLIRSHPRIFPCFYLYNSDTLTKKYDLLRDMKLSPEHIWNIWELMRAPVPVREKTTNKIT